MGEHPVLVAVRKKLADPAQPFVIQTEVKVPRGLGSRFAAAIWDHWAIWRTRGEPGCDGYNICRDNDAPESFLIRESWVNLEALKAHIASPQFVTVERALRIFAEDPPVVRVMASVADELESKPKRSMRPETAQRPAATSRKLATWLKYGGVRYPMRTGKAYFDGKTLSVVARDKKGKYHLKIHHEPVYGKVGRAALSPDCLEDYVQLKHATVRVGGRSWHVNISEIMLRSDEKGLEMGGRLGLYGQNDPPPTDHLTPEEADKFLVEYSVTAKFHEGTAWFQIKAKWVSKEEMEAEGIEMGEVEEEEEDE